MPTDKYKEKVVFALEAAIASDPDFFAAGVTPLVKGREIRRTEIFPLRWRCIWRRLETTAEKVAEALLALLEFPDFVLNAQIAGPGFINIRLKKESKCRVVNEILECKENYGRLPPCHRTILLEFVSANPTGPLHIGHGRAAAYGDSLANILAFAGYRVLREYYVNDHGRQADILAASVWLRHALDDAEQMPKGGYRGAIPCQSRPSRKPR